ncbi:MAG TPA: hypothetical protein VFT42_10370, partial [Solirubrobacteraceae bacterium]|nr:hypothetical protein [Solirubrobacteraceae bacterium]
MPLLSVTPRPKQYAAGAGASGAALAGLIAMAIALGEIFGFHGLHLGASSPEGPALELPAGLRAVGAAPGGVPLPVLRIAAAAR